MLENLISLIPEGTLLIILKLVSILVVWFVVLKTSKRVINRVVEVAIVREEGGTDESERMREQTISFIAIKTLKILVSIIAVLLMLPLLGFSVTPFVAAASIVGIAFGFGGQYLIRDVITGLFFIIENQYRIGDFVSLAGKDGTVKAITLRITTLRGTDGTIHHIPNGEIKTVSNYTKDTGALLLNIKIDVDSDIDKAEKIVNEVGAQLAKEEKDVIESPKFLRVVALGDNSITIRVIGSSRATTQWRLDGILLRRIKQAFDENGIEMPKQKYKLVD